MRPCRPSSRAKGSHERIVLLRCTLVLPHLRHARCRFQRQRRPKRIARVSMTPRKNTSLRVLRRRRRGSEERRNEIGCCTPHDGCLCPYTTTLQYYRVFRNVVETNKEYPSSFKFVLTTPACRCVYIYIQPEAPSRCRFRTFPTESFQ